MSLLWTAALTAVMTLGRLPLLGSDDPNFLYYSSVVTGLVWLVAFQLYSRVDDADSASGHSHRAWIAAVVAFLLQDTINFALFIPGSATTFFAVLALTIPAEAQSQEQKTKTDPRTGFARWIPFAVGVGALVIVAVVGIIPVARGQTHLAQARAEIDKPIQTPIADHPAFRAFQAAADDDPWDPTPHRAKAEWLMALAERASENEADVYRKSAADALAAAIERDPFDVHLHRARTDVAFAIARESRNQEDFRTALECARRALLHYPTNPPDWVHLGDVQLEAGEAAASDDLRRDAAVHFKHALDLDDRRLPWEEFHRLRPRDKDAIQEKIRRARHEP